LDRDREEQKIKNIVSFCIKIANYLHQPKMFNGVRIIKPSQIVESKWDLGAKPSTLDDF